MNLIQQRRTRMNNLLLFPKFVFIDLTLISTCSLFSTAVIKRKHQ